MDDHPLTRRARELANQGYSQYTIAILLGSTPGEVSRLCGVFHPTRKQLASEDAIDLESSGGPVFLHPGRSSA